MKQTNRRPVAMVAAPLFAALFLVVWLGDLSTSQQAAPGMAIAADALEPEMVQVGEYVETNLQLRYEDATSWRQVIHYPDAAYIKVRFALVDLAPGDQVSVSSPDGAQVHRYPGSNYTTDKEPAAGDPGFWALSIFGDTAVVELHRANNAPAGARGVAINRYARGYPLEVIDALVDGPAPGSTCGTNQRTDVACYAGSHPTEFGLAHAVVRILQFGTSHCTGWRVSPQNLMMSNEHCITSQSQLNGMEFWFDYQRTGCQSGPAIPAYQATGGSFLVDSYTYDFALFTLHATDFPNVGSFGYLELDPRTPVYLEEIYLPQHGAGNPKEFGIESDMDAGNVCRIQDAVRNGRGANSDTGYWCDTTGGSSGSPVLARSSNKVIAIHHFGTGMDPYCNSSIMNAGVRMDLIWPIVEPFFPATTLDPVLYLPVVIDE